MESEKGEQEEQEEEKVNIRLRTVLEDRFSENRFSVPCSTLC